MRDDMTRSMQSIMKGSNRTDGTTELTGFVDREGTYHPLEEVVAVLYTNWQGETRWRKIIPLGKPLRFASAEWHPEPQWLIDVYDLEKEADRTYSLKDVHKWESDQFPLTPRAVCTTCSGKGVEERVVGVDDQNELSKGEVVCTCCGGKGYS